MVPHRLVGAIESADLRWVGSEVEVVTEIQDGWFEDVKMVEQVVEVEAAFRATSWHRKCKKEQAEETIQWSCRSRQLLGLYCPYTGSLTRSLP